MHDEFFAKANELQLGAMPFATATVVRAEKPTSGKPGDKAIITADGKLHGWIGGSCAQPTVIREALKALEEGQSRFICLTNESDPIAQREGLMEFPMTCFSEGTLEIFIEPHLPQPRLLVVGTSPVAQALIELGQAMNYHVIALDADKTGTDLGLANETLTQLGDVANYIHPETYIVVASHGNYDEAALEHVLKALPRYVGLVASRKRAESVLDYLKGQGLSADELAPLKAPAGLDIQAKQGEEIALSIMAEIVQQRRNRNAPYNLSAFTMPSHQTNAVGERHASPLHENVDSRENSENEPATAIDPVCGMEIVKERAKASYEHNGETYYFCCGGCKAAFASNPDQYLQPATTAIDPICKMEVEIETAHYKTEYQGEMVYFCCAGCKSAFEKEPEKYTV